MIIGSDIISKAVSLLGALPCDAIYICIDEVVDRLHRDRLAPLYTTAGEGHTLALPSGEKHKDVQTLQTLWTWLASVGASRRSILVLIGGGSLTDLGGFAAATYMRGIRTVVLPTTLLGMVDASTGGKTAIDFAGVKNLVGAFHQPEAVVIDTAFLDTLPLDELYSGYGEVIKTALLSGDGLWRRILSIYDPQTLTPEEWCDLIDACIAYKEEIVALDPEERTGIRAVLNLGHTTAHALEAYSHDLSRDGASPLPHGYAVVIGLVVELHLSMQYLGLSRETLRQMLQLARELYPYYGYTCKVYPELLRLMRLDKKSSEGEITFVGLVRPGEAKTFTTDDVEDIKGALDFYREAFGN